MTNKVYYSNKQIKTWLHAIARQINNEDWRPDYIVGLTRGGLIPAVMLSHYLDVPCQTLQVSLQDANGYESNLWMAEDAFGYSGSSKNILIVDDINDNGATINWIIDDWRSGCFPDDHRWKEIFGNSVRFAVLINNEASKFKNPNYVGKYINKLEQDEWCVFPWENWWE